MEKINLDDWVLFSERDNSINYHSKDLNWLLKAPSEKVEFKLEDLLEEKEESNNAYSLGVPTPLVKDIVLLPNNKYAIIYEYIKDKKSISRAISEDFENKDIYIEKFVKLGNKIHSIKCDKSKYKSIEERIREGLENFDIYNEKEKKILYNFMETIEKEDTFLHVDFQTGNAITSSKGEYAIDIGLMSYGNKIYDFALYYLFSKMFVDEDKAKTFFHVTMKESIESWDTFVKYQFGITDDKKRRELEDKLMPIALLTFTAHLPQLPFVEVHKQVKEIFFNKCFKI